MRTQHQLWGYPITSASQGKLWPDDGPALSVRDCAECGRPLERTPDGWLCCPKGHGKLIPPVDQVDQADGLFSDLHTS